MSKIQELKVASRFAVELAEYSLCERHISYFDLLYTLKKMLSDYLECLSGPLLGSARDNIDLAKGLLSKLEEFDKIRYKKGYEKAIKEVFNERTV